MGLWRPPQWQSQAPQKVIINFPGQGQAQQYASVPGSAVVLPSEATTYAFDCEISIEHQQQIRKTEHPVQTGASISDHAYIIPARLILDIGMSDAMDAYFDTWSGDVSKSVSAFQTMLALQFSRIPLSITTRLRTYENMIIESLTPNETVKTIAGLRMRVEFGQIFMANTSQTPVSARSQDTNNTTLGTVEPQPPTAAQATQNKVVPDSLPATSSQAPTFDETLSYNAPGAGDWSSVNKDNLSGLPPAK